MLLCGLAKLVMLKRHSDLHSIQCIWDVFLLPFSRQLVLERHCRGHQQKDLRDPEELSSSGAHGAVFAQQDFKISFKIFFSLIVGTNTHLTLGSG